MTVEEHQSGDGDEHRRVRLALVLNGGVSLAVWMAGVVRELEIARRASRGEQRPLEDGPERRHYDYWRSRLSNTRIDIDIVSGTSAGGLNGTLLASALATGTSLQDLRPMWAASAALTEEALLHGSAPTPVTSLLDGAYFEDQAATEINRATQNEASSDGLPITLFVTATALGSADRNYQDSAERIFSAADHRCVYRFRRAKVVTHDSVGGGYQEEYRNDFVWHVDSLKRAARASAGFPVAFGPVQETTSLAGDPELSVRRPADPDHAPRWLVDGGVLDNAPFEAVLDEILSRQLESEPVDRVVAYIAPSNGRARTGKDANGERPAWTSVLRAAQGFPRESDFRDDVANIDENLLLAATANKGPDLALAQFLDDAEGDFRFSMQRTALELYPQYRTARMTVACATVQRHLASKIGKARTLGAPLTGTGPVGTWLSEDLPDSPSRLGLDATERAVRLLMKMACEARQLVAAEKLSTVVTRLSALRDEQRALIEARAQAGDVPLTTLLAGDRFSLDEIIGAVYSQMSLWRLLEDEIEQAVGIYTNGAGADRDLLKGGLVAGEVTAQALSPSLDPILPPEFEFLRIGPDQESSLVASLTDETAKDGRSLDALGEDKLYGTRLNHFGAFGRSDWRDNDWVWGRLDGAAHLARNMGLGDEGATEAQRLALESEGFSTETLLDSLRELGGMTDEGLIDKLRAEPAGRNTLELAYDSALRLLGETSEQVPRRLRKYGPLIQAALQLRNPPSWPAETPFRMKVLLSPLGRYTKGKVRSWIYELERDERSIRPGLWTRVRRRLFG
jgi:patatin-related protein